MWTTTSPMAWWWTWGRSGNRGAAATGDRLQAHGTGGRSYRDGESPRMVQILLIAALLSRSAKLDALRHNARAGVFIGPQQPSQWLQAACVARIGEPMTPTATSDTPTRLPDLRVQKILRKYLRRGPFSVGTRS